MKRIVACALAGLGAAASAPGADSKMAAAVTREATDLLESFVGWLHGFFPGIGDNAFHWIACGVLIVAAILLRKIITNVLFFYLKKLAARTTTTLDDKLFPALETPLATLVMIAGIAAAITVLQLSPEADGWLLAGARIAALAVFFWGLIRAGGAILTHLEEIADARHLAVATFMPFIKKTLLVFAVIFGALVIAQSQGLPVQSFLAGLGIGGLAVAFAAQDTIANLFGSLVVVMDQPFKVGDVVRIGGNEGRVEDIGLRSTKIRTLSRTVIAIPNKTVAAEPITNRSRWPHRQVDQVLGLTYDTTPEQLEAVAGDLRALLRADPGVQPDVIVVSFANFGASSLDVHLTWFTADFDWAKHMEVRERINLKIMRAVAARGLAFAFPTTTVHAVPPKAG